MQEPSETPYAGLSPDVVLDALESQGFEPTGGLLELNSYENRVYQLELQDGGYVVCKFYRAARWTDAQIREEHSFVNELAAAELPAVAPLARDGESLFTYQDFRFSVYPRQGGHAPDIEVGDNLEVLARTLARIHSLGSVRPFSHRPTLSAERLGAESRRFLLDSDFIPPELVPAYSSITENLLTTIDQRLPERAGWRRIHGDCHLGNLLWREGVPHFVDFDDCVNGPPMQDLWMLLSGEREEQQEQLSRILKAYLQFNDFDFSTLGYVEALRTLRIMHQAAWIGRRWHDPAFPRAFPWFGSQRFWSDHILDLREQEAALMEPPLRYLD